MANPLFFNILGKSSHFRKLGERGLFCLNANFISFRYAPFAALFRLSLYVIAGNGRTKEALIFKFVPYIIPEIDTVKIDLLQHINGLFGCLPYGFAKGGNR